jgi:hypothetical protein
LFFLEKENKNKTREAVDFLRARKTKEAVRLLFSQFIYSKLNKKSKKKEEEFMKKRYKNGLIRVTPNMRISEQKNTIYHSKTCLRLILREFVMYNPSAREKKRSRSKNFFIIFQYLVE